MINKDEKANAFFHKQIAKETLDLCDKMVNLFHGVNPDAAIPATGVIMAQVLMVCCKSRGEAYSALCINMNQAFKLMTIFYDEKDEDHKIQ